MNTAHQRQSGARSESYASHEKAKERKNAVERALRSGTTNPSQLKALADTPLADYARAYFDGLAGSIADDTVDEYRRIYTTHIAPSLGNRPVGSIRIADVKKLRAELLTPYTPNFVRRGKPVQKISGTKAPTTRPGVEQRQVRRSAKTVKQALGVLRRILDTAVENDAIPSNPANIRFGSTSTKVRTTSTDDATKRFKHQPLTAEQIAAVAEYRSQTQRQPCLTPWR